MQWLADESWREEMQSAAPAEMQLAQKAQITSRHICIKEMAAKAA